MKGTFDEEQLDEKDGDIIDDEVVKEEDECNIDESITEDIKQETYNEEDQNELLKCEMSMQQQVMQQLTDTHYHNPLFVQCREISLYWRLTLRRSLLQMQRIPVNQLHGLEETHSESLLPRSLSTQKKHLEIRKKNFLLTVTAWPADYKYIRYIHIMYTIK